MINIETTQKRFSKLGRNLKFLRTEKGMSREKFAELIEVSSRIVYDYEDGFKKPKLQTLVRIANVLDVSLDDLLRE